MASLRCKTGGISPRVGGILRAGLQAALDSTFARFLACLAHQRRLNRALNADDPVARRETMMSAANGFEVQVQVTYPQWFLDELAAARPQAVEPKDGR
jgi:hypothetical protein